MKVLQNKSSCRFLAARVVRVIYLVALVACVVWFSLMASYIDDIGKLRVPSYIFIHGVQDYLVFVLFAVFLGDAALHGISTRKLVYGIVMILLTSSVAQAYTNYDLNFAAWLVLAYPRGLDLKRAMDAIWIPGLIMTICIVTCCLIGKIPDYTTYEHGVYRHAFGFDNPNTGSIFVCSLIMAWVYCKSHAWNWRKACVIVGLLLVIYAATDSRATMILGIVQVLFTSLYTYRSKRGESTKLCSTIIFKGAIYLVPVFAVVCLVFTPLLAGFADTDAFKTINSMLSTRPALAIRFFNEYGFQLAGQQLTLATYLDNSYLNVAISCGLFGIVAIVVLYFFLGKFLEKSNDYFMALYVSLLAIHMLTEMIVFFPVENISIIAAGAFIAYDVAGRGSRSSLDRESLSGPRSMIRKQKAERRNADRMRGMSQ